MKDTDKVKTITKDLTGLIASINDEVRARREARDQAEKTLHRERTLWLPDSDICPRVVDFVERIGQHARTSYGNNLLHTFARPDSIGDQRMPWSTDEGTPWSIRCALEPSVVVDEIMRLLPTAEARGVSLAQRPALVARLERELADAEALEEAAIDEANAAGIHLEHRPYIVQRRQLAAREQAQAAAAAAYAARPDVIAHRHQLAADAAQRQQVNEAEAVERGRSGVGHSQYLAE